jgi:hypothetical protein
MRPSRSVRLWMCAALAVIAGGALALSFAPVVRAKTRTEAERLGVEATVGTVRLGWGSVWLRNVELRLPEVPALAVTLDAVEVDLGGGRLAVHGGSVVVSGPPAEVVRQVEQWRSRRPPSTGDSKTGRAITAEGIDVGWRLAAPGLPEQHAWGARYLRAADGRESISADLVRASLPGLGVELRGPEVELRRAGSARVLQRLASGGASVSVTLDAGMVAPDEKAAAAATAAERGPRLRQHLGRLAVAAGAILAPESEIDLSGLRIELRRGRELLRFGPGRLRVRREATEIVVSLLPGDLPQKTPLGARLRMPLAPGDVRFAVEGGPVSLGALGVGEGDMGLSDVSSAELEARADVVWAADGRTVSFAGSGRLSRLSIAQAWLAPRVLRGISVSLQGQGEAALDGSRLHLDDAKLEVGSVHVTLRGELERGADRVAARLEGGIPLASCQAALDSLPEGIAPLLTGMKMSGTIALDARLRFDTRRLAETALDWRLGNECRVTAVPAAVDPRRFHEPWTRRVLGADGREATIESGPGTPDWVPFSSMSPYLETAVTICEDARFRRHRGFDQEAITNSIRENLKARRFLRGASTISMQLAKNLYLPREKTLSRKLQEAVLTLLLEQELSKDEILELYFNVIEFGPGIYGIGPAARYYFHTTPGALSLGQALYLGSILPRPQQSHFGADGQLNPGWADYLRRLMQLALKIKRISQEELDEGLRETLVFGQPYASPVPFEGEAPPPLDGASPPDAPGATRDPEAPPDVPEPPED